MHVCNYACMHVCMYANSKKVSLKIIPPKKTQKKIPKICLKKKFHKKNSKKEMFPKKFHKKRFSKKISLNQNFPKNFEKNAPNVPHCLQPKTAALRRR